MEMEPINASYATYLMTNLSYEFLHEGDEIYDVPLGIVLLLSLLYGTISLLAVIGNLLVIWIVVTTRTMQTVTNWYIANLAMADVVIGAFAIPFQFHAALLQRWTLPHFMCQFCPFVQQVSVSVSVLTLTAIAIDRHRAIINPLRARQSKYVSRIIIFCIWTVSVLVAMPWLFILHVITHEHVTKRDDSFYFVRYFFCDRQRVSAEDLGLYRCILVTVQFVIPFCVISFVYIQMAVRLWGSKTPGNAQNERDQTLLRNKKKVVKMLVIVVVLFAVCWLPLQSYNIVEVSTNINEYKYINIIWFVCDWLAMSNSCYNPFIYGIYNEKFKREFLRRCPFCRFSPDPNYDCNESRSMYTRATSLRVNLTNVSVRHNGSTIHHNQLATAAPALGGSSSPYHHSANYYNQQHLNGKGNNANGNGVNKQQQRFSGGVELELKPVSQRDPNRKIVFQPIRTASLKNNRSAQNGPLLGTTTGINSNGDAGILTANKTNDGLLFSPMDLSEAPLLSRIADTDRTQPVGLDNGNRGGDGVVFLRNKCPDITFEDVDL